MFPGLVFRGLIPCLLLPLLIAIFVMAGCSSQRAVEQVPRTELQQLLAGESLLLPAAAQVDRHLSDPMALDASARRVMDDYFVQSGNDFSRIEFLIQTLFSPQMLGITYAADATLSAVEVLQQQQANCLSASMLMASLLRYAGYRVQFQQVDVPPRWTRLDANDPAGEHNSYSIARHVNIKVVSPRHGRDIVIDFNQRLRNAGTGDRVRPLRDDEVRAQYYNNLAVAAMMAGQQTSAFGLFQRALQLAPEDGDIWSNFGVFYRRSDRYPQAQLAFQHAVYLSPHSATPLNNLVALYTATGEEAKAAHYLAAVQAWRNRNPYYRYALAQEAFQQADYIAARKHLAFVQKTLDPDADMLAFIARVEAKVEQLAN